MMPQLSNNDGQPARQQDGVATEKKHLGGRKLRSHKQRLKERFAKVREDAQLAGVIPVAPEGGVRDERVNPVTQSEQQLPTIVQAAISGGWAVPEDVKRKVIQSLAKPFYEESTKVITKTGDVVEVPTDPYLLKENAKVLLSADKHQWEKDNPEEAGKVAGADQVVDISAMLKRAAEQRAIDHSKLEVEVVDGATTDTP